MSRRVKLYAGPAARVRYVVTSNIAKWLGLGVLALAIIGAIIGSIPYVPAIYERANASIAEAGVFVRDNLTIARTITPAHESATALSTRFSGAAMARDSVQCHAAFEGQNIPTTQRRAISLAETNLQSSLDTLWVDAATVERLKGELVEAWNTYLQPGKGASDGPGCITFLQAAE